jgi:16S rRNA (cytosine1402-N4)-methyltransferase
MSESVHVPVLVDEVLHLLAVMPGQIVVDGTLGGGGHTRRLAAACSGGGGRVIALDRDPAAVERAARELKDLPVEAVLANFRDLPEVLPALQVERVDRVLLDLGLSSDQLADDRRGFSFDSGGPFDLRYDTTRGDPAWKLINRLGERHLADLIFQYGEERYSRRIARAIIAARRDAPLRTAREVAETVRRAVPGPRQRIDPATRTFQALRIAVNDELQSLQAALQRIPPCIHSGGRLGIISFHSLEDRLVKQAFRRNACFETITRKPVRPTETEVRRNPRSRSARLRVAAIVR